MTKGSPPAWELGGGGGLTMPHRKEPVKVKVTFSLCSIKYLARKIYWGVEI
jgi:hypothetical protein